MLLVKRRIGETVFIAKNIQVTITAIKGNQVQLGIVAPDHVEVLREELIKPTTRLSPSSRDASMRPHLDGEKP